MKIDRYVKFLLTVIALGVMSINLHFYKASFVNEANAEVNNIDLMLLGDRIVSDVVEQVDDIVLSRNHIIMVKLEDNKKELGKAIALNLLVNGSLANEGLNISEKRVKEIIKETIKIVGL